MKLWLYGTLISLMRKNMNDLKTIGYSIWLRIKEDLLSEALDDVCAINHIAIIILSTRQFKVALFYQVRTCMMSNFLQESWPRGPYWTHCSLHVDTPSSSSIPLHPPPHISKSCISFCWMHTHVVRTGSRLTLVHLKWYSLTHVQDFEILIPL